MAMVMVAVVQVILVYEKPMDLSYATVLAES